MVLGFYYLLNNLYKMSKFENNNIVGTYKYNGIATY